MIFSHFRNIEFFKTPPLTFSSYTFQYVNGQNTKTLTKTRVVRDAKLVVPIEAKELMELGQGQYSANETYAVYLPKPVQFEDGTLSKVSDHVSYKGKDYKIMSVLNFSDQGFYKYIITHYTETSLNR